MPNAPYHSENALSPTRRYGAILLLAILFALGLGIRLHYALDCKAVPSYSDMAYYNTLALQRGVPSEAPPGYPLLLRLIYALWGARNYEAVFVVQSVLSAVTILLVYLVARRVSGTRAALIAAGIAAIYPSFIAYNLTTMTETVSVLIVTLLFAALTVPSSERARAILAAVVFTVGFLFRPVLLFCVPGAFFSVKRRILFVVSLALILGPVLSYDLIAGKNALRGARGFYLTYNPTTTNTHGLMKNTQLKSNDLPAGTYLENALAFVKTNKMRVVDIVYHKASILLSRGSDQFVLRPITGPNENAVMLLMYGHIPVMVLGAVGMLRYMDPNTKRVALPALSYLVFVILFSIFKVRYRLPAEPAMIVFAGITLAHATRISLPRPRLSWLKRLAAPPAPDPRDGPALSSEMRVPGASRWRRIIPETLRRDWDIIGLILLCSLALRFYFAFAADAPINGREHVAMDQFVERGRLGAGVAPLYPLFLRGTYAVFGALNHRAVFIVQAAAVAAAMMLLAAAVSSAAGRKAGIIAGVLGVVFPNMLLAHLSLSPVPFTVLCATALMAIAASRRPASTQAALSGVIAGVGILLAPAFAYIVPGLAAVQRRWRLFIIVLMGTLLPYTVFNVVRHGRLEPVYEPSLYEIEAPKMIGGKAPWGGVRQVYTNAVVALSKQWSVDSSKEIDAATRTSTFVAGYGFVAILYAGLIGLVRCWRNEHWRVFLPPLLYMILLVLVSKVELPDRAVFETVLVAYAAILLGGTCGGQRR